MKFHATITLAVILVLTAATSLANPADAQEVISVGEAMRLFERLGCTSCHNGQTALSFEDAVLLIDSWRGKYASLDEAVAAEIEYFGGQRFQGYDDMFERMAANVGKTLDDPDVMALYDFFKAVYEGGVDISGLQPPADEAGEPEEVEEGPANTAFYATLILGVVAAVVLLVAFARAWR